VRRELRLVAAYFGDEAPRVLAPDERLDGVTERVIGTRAFVEDHVQGESAC
jgi:hypothetical protein